MKVPFIIPWHVDGACVWKSWYAVEIVREIGLDYIVVLYNSLYVNLFSQVQKNGHLFFFFSQS